MIRMWLAVLAVMGMHLASARAYVEAPHTLGLVCRDSTNIVLVEVSKINREKNLIIFKKVKDLKGMHPTTEIKHNIGRGGFHPREWQNIMNWAEEGKKAIFFHNGGASETCMGTYWYQCYNQGEWWGMSHAEPFLLRTFYGNIDKLADAVTQVVAGREVIVTCLADGDKNQLHERKGKLQRLRASLKRIDYNAKRDFVALGGDGEDYEEFRSTVIMADGSAGWRYLPTNQLNAKGDAWTAAEFDDRAWRTGKAPIGYGEEELKKRGGVVITEIGQPFCFRREFELPASMLLQKGLTIRVAVASDNCSVVYLNGQLADREETDHEFAYWNREIDVPAKMLRPGRNVVAVLVPNTAGSSDLYFDMEISAQVPLPKRIKPIVATGPVKPVEYKIIEGDKAPSGDGKPAQIAVDKQKKTVTLPARVAQRKLPTLNDIYPIEVIATYPAPRGQKAHETVISFTDVRPSDVQRALMELGLKPGKPARGENTKAEGPTLKLFLEMDKGGQPQRVPIERTLVMRESGKPVPDLTWHFTGSSLRQPDPEKNEAFVGADVTGTLISLFPVTDDTIIQSALTLNDEPNYRLDTNATVLPPIGTQVRLVIVAN